MCKMSKAALLPHDFRRPDGAGICARASEGENLALLSQKTKDLINRPIEIPPDVGDDYIRGFILLMSDFRHITEIAYKGIL